MMAKSARFHNRKASSHSRGGYALFPARNQRGIALLLSLMLLTLMSVMSIIMVMTVSPDMLINGYYGNFRGSFYAADSGLNIARQQLVNQISSSTYVSQTVCSNGWGTGAGTGCTGLPLDNSTGSNGAAGKVITAVLSTGSGGYGGSSSLNASGTAGAASWPENFQLINTTICPSTFAPVAGTPTAQSNNNGLITAYLYQYKYQLCSLGWAKGGQQVYTSENGIVNLTISTNGQTRNYSFAAWGGFVSNYPANSGALIGGTFEGPMFTNGAWQFENGQKYIFTGPVGQASPNVDYDINGTWYDSPTASYSKNGVTVAPTFEGGLNLNQPAIPLPTDDFSQKWAVLDGVGCGEGSTTCGSGTPPNPTSAQMNAALKDINGNAYPSGSPPSSGVFLPYSCVGSTCTMNGGGIYVEGNAGVLLTPSTDSNGNQTQVYTITQGSTTTTVTVPVWNTANNAPPAGAGAYTKMVSGTKSVTVSGIPMNNVPTTPQPGTLLYVDGTISSLSGPGEGQAAIQNYSQVTVVANQTVNITGDLRYQTEPNSLDTNDTYLKNSPTTGQLLDTGQALGVFTAKGNINLSTSYSDKNLWVDGALAPIGQNCASNMCGFTTSGSINIFNNFGAQSQTNIFAGNMNVQNLWYDTRFATGFGPPWFPTASVLQSDINPGPPTVIATVNRLSWSTSPQ